MNSKNQTNDFFIQNYNSNLYVISAINKCMKYDMLNKQTDEEKLCITKELEYIVKMNRIYKQN